MRERHLDDPSPLTLDSPTDRHCDALFDIAFPDMRISVSHPNMHPFPPCAEIADLSLHANAQAQKRKKKEKSGRASVTVLVSHRPVNSNCAMTKETFGGVVCSQGICFFYNKNPSMPMV